MITYTLIALQQKALSWQQAYEESACFLLSFCCDD